MINSINDIIPGNKYLLTYRYVGSITLSFTATVVSIQPTRLLTKFKVKYRYVGLDVTYTKEFYYPISTKKQYGIVSIKEDEYAT